MMDDFGHYLPLAKGEGMQVTLSGMWWHAYGMFTYWTF